MTANQEREETRWRRLKEVYEYYLAHTRDRDDRSAADLIASCADQDKIAEIRRDVQQQMTADAAKSIWIAFGCASPDSYPQLISPEHWAFLTVDIESNAAFGNGLSFWDLWCAIWDEISKNDPLYELVEGRHPEYISAGPIIIGPTGLIMGPTSLTAPEKRVDLKNGAPGRPSGMHLVEREFALRRKAGKLEGTLNEQARSLADWFKIQHTGINPPTPKTIANRIRRDFRAAKVAARATTPEIIVRD